MDFFHIDFDFLHTYKAFQHTNQVSSYIPVMFTIEQPSGGTSLSSHGHNRLTQTCPSIVNTDWSENNLQLYGDGAVKPNVKCDFGDD